ncbi:hypothetical protein IAR50_004380 [Cryptococcus sp. DSM 104548]
MTALLPLFTQPAYSEVVVGIFDCLALPDVLSFIRVNKYVHDVFATSSRLQLAHTQRLFSVPPPAFRQTAAPADRLAALKERQRRMDELDPSLIKTIRKGLNADLIGFENGMIVFLVEGESLKKRKRDNEEEHERWCKKVAAGDDVGDLFALSGPHEAARDDASSGSGVNPEDAPDPDRFQQRLSFLESDARSDESSDGWDVYRAPGAASDSDSLDRGGRKDQGLWHWKTRTSAEFQHLELCGEDNLVAMIQKGAYFPNGMDPETSRLSLRITFHCALPPLGTPAPTKGFLDPIPHPDAALPFIELLFPIECGATDIDVKLGPGGQLSISMNDPTSFTTRFSGIWDWKRGVCLGSIPVAEDQNISTIIPCGPFAFTASARRIPASASPDLYAKAAAALQLHLADIPDELQGFVQLSFDAYCLIPPSLGFPAMTPNPPDSNPFAQAYPDMSCSWYIPDVPPAFLVGQFDLPLEDLLPYTLAAAYQPGVFDILDLKYSPCVHNTEALGIFTWGLWGKTHVADLSSLLSQATDLTCRLMMAEMLYRPKHDLLRLTKLLPEFSKDPRSVVAGKASEALVRMKYEGRVAEHGSWIEKSDGCECETEDGESASGSVSELENDSDGEKVVSNDNDSGLRFIDTVDGQGLMASFKSSLFNHPSRADSKPNTSSPHPAPSPDPLSKSGPALTLESSPPPPDQAVYLPNTLTGDVSSFLSPATIPIIPYSEWQGSSHMRMGFDSTLSTMYGSREMRLVPVRWWDVDSDEDEDDGEEETRSRKSRFVLSLSDYNESTLPPIVRAKRRMVGRHRREMDSFKALLSNIPDAGDDVAITARKIKIDKTLSELENYISRFDSLIEVENKEMDMSIDRAEKVRDEDVHGEVAMTMIQEHKNKLFALFEGRLEVTRLFKDLKGLAAASGMGHNEMEKAANVEEDVSPDGLQTANSVGLRWAPNDDSTLVADLFTEATRDKPKHPPPPYLTLTLAASSKPTPYSETSSGSHAATFVPRTLAPSTSTAMPDVLQDYYAESFRSEDTRFTKRSREAVLIMETDPIKPPGLFLDGSSLLLGGFTPYDYHIINF